MVIISWTVLCNANVIIEYDRRRSGLSNAPLDVEYDNSIEYWSNISNHHVPRVHCHVKSLGPPAVQLNGVGHRAAKQPRRPQHHQQLAARPIGLHLFQQVFYLMFGDERGDLSLLLLVQTRLTFGEFDRSALHDVCQRATREREENN